MAIKLPNLKNNLKKKPAEPTQNTQLHDLLNDIPTLPTDSANGSAKPAKKPLFTLKRTPKVAIATDGKKPIDKKTMITAGFLGFLVVVGALIMFVLPTLTKTEEPTPVAERVATPVVEPTATASTPVTANASATADNLRTEEVVITGEQLGNGVPSSTASTPVVTTENPPNADNSDNQAVVVAESETTPPPAEQPSQELMQTEQKSKKGNAISNGQKGTMSYAEFVKASEQQVFSDR